MLASLVAYAAVREQQRGQVDDALRGNAAFYQRLAARAGGGPPPGRPGERTPPPSLGGPGGYAQLVRPNGNAIELGPAGGPALPVTGETLATANGESGGGFSDHSVDGLHLRVLTAAARADRRGAGRALARRTPTASSSACGACSSRSWPSAPRSRPA